VHISDQAQFSSLPPAITHQDGEQTLPASPTRTKADNFERPRRSSSMIMNPGDSAPPQPSGSIAPSQTSHPLGASQAGVGTDDQLTLTRTTSSTGLTLDGIEPKMFPGVVSRRRGSSMRGSNVDECDATQSQAQFRQGGHSGFRRTDGSSVVEEQDSDDE
jgi:AMP deaminase